MAKPSEDEKRRAVRAEEWRQFRRDFLYSQSNLADALRCSRRTVVSVECG
jgi:DNA-binding XRE family transcriptional regulator